MIYSKDIEKRCGLCRDARIENDEFCYCERRKERFPLSRDACPRFSYDILKKPVRRGRRRKSDFKPEDFSL